MPTSRYRPERLGKFSRVANGSASWNRKFPHRVTATDFSRRNPILDLLWTLNTVFKYGGLLLALAGVAIFGWYFVGANARAALRDSGDGVAWGGPRALIGAKVLAAGLVIQLAAFAVAAFLPGRL